MPTVFRKKYETVCNNSRSLSQMQGRTSYLSKRESAI